MYTEQVLLLFTAGGPYLTGYYCCLYVCNLSLREAVLSSEEAVLSSEEAVLASQLWLSGCRL